jgi:hypothetical protein
MDMNRLPQDAGVVSMEIDVQVGDGPEANNYAPVLPLPELDRSLPARDMSPALQRSLGRVADEMGVTYSPNGNLNGSVMAHDSMV